MQKTYAGKIFRIGQFIGIVDKAVGSGLHQSRNMKRLDKNFRSHIMLAVTQVNGCIYCSYVHTKHALESGSSEQDIAMLMEGDLAKADEEERVALLFAQHYADSSAAYDDAAYDRVIEYYGEEKAKGILAAIRMITLGNAHGGTMNLFVDRFKGKRNKASSLVGELAIVLGIFIIFPIVLLKNLIIFR